MKIKITLAIMVICALASIALAQTVAITPKKTVYKRKIVGVYKKILR